MATRQLFKVFKSKGLSLTSEASKILERHLLYGDGSGAQEELVSIMDEIGNRIVRRESKSSNTNILFRHTSPISNFLG